MPHNLRVGDSIRLTGEANTKDNVKGNLSTERMCSVDWFDGKAINTTNDYTGAAGSALSAGGVPGVTLTTSATDNVVYYLAGGLIFDITQNPEIETKIYITDVSGTFVYFGFSDAVSETSPAATIDADSGTITAVATDAAGFVIDADLGSSSIYCASVKTGGTAQSVDTALDWTDTVSHVLRVKLDALGNAYFFVDGIEKGYIALAVADVPLCAIINFGTRANDGANVVYARYLKKWQDIP